MGDYVILHSFLEFLPLFGWSQSGINTARDDENDVKLYYE